MRRIWLWILTFVRMTGGGGGALAMPLVILTEVRIQGYGVRRVWLWALTFVRVTGWAGERGGLGERD